MHLTDQQLEDIRNKEAKSFYLQKLERKVRISDLKSELEYE